jgi:hypothetical protein
MRQVISSSLDPLFSSLRQVAEQQGAQVQQQWGQLQHLYHFPEHHGPAVQVALKQGQAAHEDSLGQQEQLLQQWKLLGLQQGLVTVNCLSLKQMTTLIAVSSTSTCLAMSPRALMLLSSHPHIASDLGLLLFMSNVSAALLAPHIDTFKVT